MAAQIILVDDHALVRVGFRRLFDETSGELEVLAEAGDGAAALDLAESTAPAVWIIDLDLGDSISGHELLVELRRRGSRAAILICSMTTAPHVVAYAILAGADGYLFKNAAPEEALRAVRTVLAGQKYLPVSSEILRGASARFAGRSARAELGTESRSPGRIQTAPVNTIAEEDTIFLDSLTPRERELMRFLRRGLSSREAAALMGVGEKTIERHRANIRSKHALSEEAFVRLLGAR